MSTICSAPDELESWCSTRDLSGVVDRYELRLPKSASDGNKATLALEYGRYLGSFTIWGAGTTEWIVVDGESGVVLVTQDAEFKTVTELCVALDSALTDMTERVR